MNIKKCVSQQAGSSKYGVRAKMGFLDPFPVVTICHCTAHFSINPTFMSTVSLRFYI